MNTNQISILFHSLGICPTFKGYQFLLYIVLLATDYKDKPFPTLKTLYVQTGEHFGVSSSIICHDIRTLLRTYWNQDHAAAFSLIIHYPVKDKLTTKEFISVVAQYLISNP